MHHLIFIFLCIISGSLQANYHVNLFGLLDDQHSLSKHAESFIHCLHTDTDLSIKFFATHPSLPYDLSPAAQHILSAGIDMTMTRRHHSSAHPKNHELTGTAIYTNLNISKAVAPKNFEKTMQQCQALLAPDVIRIGFDVCDSSRLPQTRVNLINKFCDAVIVPDPYLVNLYKKSGVIHPVFALPLTLNLETLLNRSIKKAPQKPFVFGFSGAFFNSGRKNHERLVQAFAQEFRNNPDVLLKIHGRFGPAFDTFAAQCKALKTNNIDLQCKGFDRQEYEDFMASLDCYVTAAKAEGFAITPREALALGIPCIVANNTAQKTICNSGYVYAMRSDILEPSKVLGGYWFNTDITEIRKAMREVYENYNHYLALAHQGRRWVTHYEAKNLAPLYRSLVLPHKVILGDRDEITAEYLMTTSRKLYQKYQQACKDHRTQFLDVQTEV